jgi:putative transposase
MTEVDDVPSVEPTTVIGVDMGMKSLVALSTGDIIEYPRYYIQAEKKLAAAQRSLSRKKNESASRRKAKLKVAKISNRTQNLRDEFLHQVSRKLVDSADLIVFENLNIQAC